MLDNFFFSESRAVYEIMWKNIVQRDRPQMTIWRMRIACWIAHTICNTDCFSTATMVGITRLNVMLYVHWLSCHMARIMCLPSNNGIIPYCGRHLNIMGQRIFRSWHTRWMERGNPDMLGNLELNRGRTLFLELSTKCHARQLRLA